MGKKGAPLRGCEVGSFGVLMRDSGFDAIENAKRVFGVEYLTAWQRLVVANILDAAGAADCGDEGAALGKQIVLLPTGSGKSLCFLAPALALNGPTLIVYPLTALMNEQAGKIRGRSLECAVFKGGQSEKERAECFSALDRGAKFILSNPETLMNPSLLARLAERKVAHVAIDEAHCVCEWGDSFRPAYLELPRVIKTLGSPIVTAFTATAGPRVLRRISDVLFEGEARLIQSSADRENIHYSVVPAASKKKALIRLCLSEKRPALVFCSTRGRAEMTARLLASYFGDSPQKQTARFYHAGLSAAEKEEVERWFFASNDGILCATCAYGMGMDKPDIATVIHFDASASPESFIQEAGRAGRNGSDVRSILLWSDEDDRKFSFGSSGEDSSENGFDERRQVIKDYAVSKTCRRQLLMNYLTGEQVFCSGCDICDEKSRGKQIARDEDKIAALAFIKKHNFLFAKEEITQLLMNRFNARDLKTFSQNVWEAADVNEILNALLSEKKIKIAGRLRNRALCATKEGRAFLKASGKSPS